jgi:hypothetical protein
MRKPDSLQIGDLVQLSGGYSLEPGWLAGLDSITGPVVAFTPGQNDAPAAVIKLDKQITFAEVTGDVLVLELRYVGAAWEPLGIVHVELCDFTPDATPWRDRRKGQWVESHASYERLAA